MIFDEAIKPNYTLYDTDYITDYELLKFVNTRNTYTLKAVIKISSAPYEVFKYLRSSFFDGSETFNYLTYGFYIYDNDVFLRVSHDTFGSKMRECGKYTIKLYSTNYDAIKDMQTQILARYKDSTVNSIVWTMTAPNGDTISKEMEISNKNSEAINEFYPWLRGRDLNEYYNSYFASDENILLLVGDPGTGKTTFIKNMLLTKGLSAVITYDEKLMRDDGFFLDFITGDKDILIIEDADTLIYDREKEGNNIMSKILNVSDGIIKNVDKKIIFSTNITDISRIDSALMRPGRCFDTIEFTKLSREQATAILKAKNITRELSNEKKFFTLAEILSSSDREQRSNKHRVGF